MEKAGGDEGKEAKQKREKKKCQPNPSMVEKKPDHTGWLKRLGLV